MARKANDNELKAGQKRKSESGEAMGENNPPVVPAEDPNSTSPNTQVDNRNLRPGDPNNPDLPEIRQKNTDIPGEVPGQPVVEKNRIPVPDVSHAGERNDE
jgi:hypothetical protein